MIWNLMGIKLIGRDRPSAQFREFAHAQNVRIHKIFMAVLVFICLLLWLDNSDTIKPINTVVLLTYSNIAGAFTFLFLAKWLMLMVSNHSRMLQAVTLWMGIIEIFAFIFCLGLLDVKQGSGLVAPALGFVIIAVLFSTRMSIMISLFLIGGALFYYIALQLEGVPISNYRVSLISIIILSIIIFVTTERQRRTVFRTQKLLAEKVDELNKALDVKSVFLGHMSHELRTPLNAILGFSDMIINETYAPRTLDKVKEYVGFINSGGRHLLKLVDDILDSAKIEAGEITVKIEKVDLKQSLANYIDELGAISKANKQTVLLTMEDDKLDFNSDKRLFKQIIFNLLSNAQKFTGPGGLIEVCVCKSPNSGIGIVVKDNGKGMDKELLTLLNDEATYIESQFITRAEGTGLGLVIVRQLIQLLQASIEFKSEPDLGTEITMSFPQ